MVGGVSSFDKHLEAIYRESLHSYEATLDFTYLTDLDMPSLLERLKRLPDHRIRRTGFWEKRGRGHPQYERTRLPAGWSI